MSRHPRQLRTSEQPNPQLTGVSPDAAIAKRRVLYDLLQVSSPSPHGAWSV